MSFDFARIAVALRCAASQCAGDVEQVELLAARMNSRGVDHALRETRERAQLIGEAHSILRGLIGCESEVLALLEKNTPREGAARKMEMVPVHRPAGSPRGL